MTIQTWFFTCLTATVIGIIALFINLATASIRMFSDDHPLSGVKSILIGHILAGLLYVLGGIGTIVSGIVWIVTYLKH